MKSLVCDGCLKPSGGVVMLPGWSQLSRRPKPGEPKQNYTEPKVWHFCGDQCLLEFVNSKGWEQQS